MARKAKTSKTRKPRARQIFTVGKRTPKELGPQAQLVYDALAGLGTADAVAIGEAANRGGKLHTKQDTTRVAAFYLAAFRKAGLVRVVKATKAS